MKHKNLLLITCLSVTACVLHAVMLNTPFNLYLYTSAVKVVLFVLFPLIYFKASKDLSLKDLFKINSGKTEKKYLKFSLIFGFGVFGLIILFYIILRPFLDNEMIIGALESFGITPANFIFVFIYIVLINAALEELFFRGFIFTGLHKAGFKLYAHVFSALLFSVYHVTILDSALSIGMFLFCVFGLFVSGLIFNFFVLKCKNILGALIVHISANFALNLIVLSYLLFK